MRVLLTGAAGLLGSELVRAVPRDVELVVTRHRSDPPARSDGGAIDVVDLDLRQRRPVQAAWQAIRPDVVLHAAYAKDEAGIVGATRNVAGATDDVGAALVHVSSDVVFGGRDAPHAEDALLDPSFAYGRWKAEAEAVVAELAPGSAVVRTSLLVRLDPPDHGTRWVLDLAAGRVDGALFDDEVRQPLLAADLARFLWALVDLPADARSGPWHAVGPDPLTRLELGRLVAAHHGLDPSTLSSTSSADLDLDRPRVLRLSCERAAAAGLPLPGPLPTPPR